MTLGILYCTVLYKRQIHHVYQTLYSITLSPHGLFLFYTFATRLSAMNFRICLTKFFYQQFLRGDEHVRAKQMVIDCVHDHRRNRYSFAGTRYMGVIVRNGDAAVEIVEASPSARACVPLGSRYIDREAT